MSGTLPPAFPRNCRETAGEVPPQVVTLVCLTPAELEELSRATSRLQQDRMLLPTSLRIASGAVQIQLAPVIGRIRPTAEIQPEIAQSLVDRQRARLRPASGRSRRRPCGRPRS